MLELLLGHCKDFKKHLTFITSPNAPNPSFCLISMLHSALLQGADLPFLQRLIEVIREHLKDVSAERKAVLNHQDAWGMTAAMAVVLPKRKRVYTPPIIRGFLQALDDARADLFLANEKDGGRTLLHYAVASMNPGCVEWPPC